MSHTKFETNLSEGSVVKQLLKFAVPFIISNIIQTLYGVIDMIVVGQFCGTESMSGVNIAGQVTLIVTNLVIGLSAGATVLIGQYLGAGDKKALKETIGTLFSTLLISAVIFSVVVLLTKTQILEVINTPKESMTEALEYLTVTMLGTIFIFAYNALSAVMRGMGDSKRPLVFVGIACTINIGLDLLFVAVFDLRAFGAGLATVLSQAISVILCIIYLVKNQFVFDFKLESFRIRKERLKMLMKIGVPMTFQSLAVSLSFMALTMMVNTLGVTASAAVGAVGKFNGFAILPAIAVGNAVAAMSAHNFGAGKAKRANETMIIGVILAFSMSIVMFLLVKVFPEPILRMFADDEAMVAAGMEYIDTFSFDYLFVPFVFCLNGLFNGSGHSMITLVIGIVSSLAARIPAAYFFGIYLGWGLKGVGIGAPAATLIASLIAVGFYISGQWKKSTVLIRD